MRHNGLATFVGEESVGGYGGNTNGMISTTQEARSPVLCGVGLTDATTLDILA